MVELSDIHATLQMEEIRFDSEADILVMDAIGAAGAFLPANTREANTASS